ncbi:MAG: hypothetical protein IPK60_18545 [Sandaracinaceae bacterium]|nr:hypothetical protein [Sandaracinaceae bacterium]
MRVAAIISLSLLVLLWRAFAAAPARATDTPRTMRMCPHEIRWQQSNRRDGCWVDVEMTQAPGVLHTPCDGGFGPAVAIFGNRTFAGLVNNGVITMTLTTSFHYGDGCDWTTMQTIAGPVAADELNFTYNEAPRPNQSGCLPSCEAHATLRVSH